ncbi:hypothetical protein NFI96_009458 [Prochilodus magdalenae]|nr:hypothetical protein NFI96_009458 [Prochilodus magdalenae]
MDIERVDSYKYLGVHLNNKLDCGASAIFYGVVCWGSSISTADRKRLDKLLKRAGSVLGSPLDPVQVVGDRRMISKLASMLENDSHPMHSGSTWQLLQRQAASPQVCEGAVSKTTSYSNSTSCPLDPIPSTLLQSISLDLLPFVSSLINCSLSSGHVPQAFKTARVVPILRKPSLDSSDISSYRPVSLLSFLSKILERTVDNQLSFFLSQNQLQDINQSGFKSAHSTETALIAVTEKLHAARSAKLSSVLILLDLSAAFNTVNHKILLSVLTDLGITGTAWKWFESYLEDRHYQVTWNGSTSAPCRLFTGVPQGLVLRPPLLPLYTLSLGEVITSHGFSYGNSLITPTEDARSLVVILDGQLSFSAHIANPTWSCRFLLYNIRRIRPFLSQEATQLLVQSLVISRLDYCNSLLAGLPLRAIRPLQLVQNAAARLIFNLPKFTHITSLLRSLHWLPVVARIRFKTLMLAYKAKNGPAPTLWQCLAVLDLTLL